MPSSIRFGSKTVHTLQHSVLNNDPCHLFVTPGRHGSAVKRSDQGIPTLEYILNLGKAI